MTDLHAIARQMVQDGRGVLAADESIGTMTSRLEAAGIAGTAENRRAYRETLLTGQGLGDVVSGVIWCAETFEDSLADGTPFPVAARERGILPGIKVDTGTSLLPRGDGATITEGLDKLGERLAYFAKDHAAFAKWRAVIDVNNASVYSIEANAHALARYAALCQEHGIVPIVEPEVLTTGDHSIATCADVSTAILRAVFDQLRIQKVDLAGMVLKPNMITPGLDAAPAPADEVAARTLAVLTETVPSEVPGIAFLSGGHPTANVCSYLGEMNGMDAPWSLTFSFGRALVSAALTTWSGDAAKVPAAQAVLLEACRAASDASRRREPQPA